MDGWINVIWVVNFHLSFNSLSLSFSLSFWDGMPGMGWIVEIWVGGEFLSINSLALSFSLHLSFYDGVDGWMGGRVCVWVSFTESMRMYGGADRRAGRIWLVILFYSNINASNVPSH